MALHEQQSITLQDRLFVILDKHQKAVQEKPKQVKMDEVKYQNVLHTFLSYSIMFWLYVGTSMAIILMILTKKKQK